MTDVDTIDFRNGTSRKFTIIDSYVQERMTIIAGAGHGRTGRNSLPYDHDRVWLEQFDAHGISNATQAVKVHA